MVSKIKVELCFLLSLGIIVLLYIVFNRLYETQVKKIIKVQCMMRAFVARRNAIKSKAKDLHSK